jgi:diguanylate cyclase (GGDEF)-like protein/PAS domain S-box-containing protein
MENEQGYQQQMYLTALHETALALMNRLNINELLETIVKRACEILQTPHGFIYLVQPEVDALVLKVGIGTYKSYLGVHRKKDAHSASSEVWKTGKALAIVDYPKWDGRATDRHLARDAIQAIIGLPLTSGLEVVGVIGVGFREKKESFSQEKLYTMERFADLASIALDNAKLYQELQMELEEKKRVEVALRESEMNYRGIFDAVNDLIFVIDAQTSEIVDINQKVIEFFEFSCCKEECIRNIATDLKKTLTTVVQQSVGVFPMQRYVVEWQLKEQYSPIWMEISTRQVLIGSCTRVLAVARDVTDRMKFEKQLEYQAYHDALTGLPNRRMLEKYLDRVIGETRKKRAVIAVIYIDLDGFKQVNDWFGHNIGDDILKQVAVKIGNCMRRKDIVARMGGDEFIVVLNDFGDREDLTIFLHQLKKACHCSLEMTDRSLTVTASIGVSVFPDDGQTSADLIRQADKAMYVCKEASREC